MKTLLTFNQIPENTTLHFRSANSGDADSVTQIKDGAFGEQLIEVNFTPDYYRIETKYADRVLKCGKDAGASWVKIGDEAELSAIDLLVPDFTIIDELTKSKIFPAKTLIEKLYSLFGENKQFPKDTLQGAYIRVVMLSSIMESATKAFLSFEDEGWECVCGKNMSLSVECKNCKKTFPLISPPLSKSSEAIFEHITKKGHEWLSFFNLSTEERSVDKSELGINIEKHKVYYGIVAKLRNKIVHQLSIDETEVATLYKEYLKVNQNGHLHGANSWEIISHIALYISVEFGDVLREDEVRIIEKIKNKHYKVFCADYYPEEIINLNSRKVVLQVPD